MIFTTIRSFLLARNIQYILISFLFSFVSSQNTLNGVAAVVGENIITHMDVYQQMSILEEQGKISPDKYLETELLVLESMIDRLVLLDFAERDSMIYIDDNEVNSQIELQIDNFIGRLGSIQAVEEYFGEDINMIKKNYWKEVYESMLIERYKYSLVSGVDVGKKEVEFFYLEYKDSLQKVPININVDIVNIAFLPSLETINRVLDRLVALKDSVALGYMDFDEAISKNSSVPSASVVGFTERGSLYEEYEKAAYSADVGDVVGPVKTSAGAHLIKVLDRKGEKIKTQPLLIVIPASENDKKKTVEQINFLYEGLLEDPLFVEDYLNNNEGLFGFSGIHQNIFISSFTEELQKHILGLNEGGVLAPTVLGDGSIIIAKLHEFFEESEPTLDNSYEYLSALAKDEKKNNLLIKWLIGARSQTYIDKK